VTRDGRVPGADEILDRLDEATALVRHGDRHSARSLLEDLWSHVGGGEGDALYRCAIAHQLADLQDRLSDELAWDLAALDAAESVTDERLAPSAAAAAVRGLFPSLHLNLADGYRRLGDHGNARLHLERGRRACIALSDTAYGDMIRTALDRVGQRLGDASPRSHEP
jgi:hypothetical protein